MRINDPLPLLFGTLFTSACVTMDDASPDQREAVCVEVEQHLQNCLEQGERERSFDPSVCLESQEAFEAVEKVLALSCAELQAGAEQDPSPGGSKADWVDDLPTSCWNNCGGSAVENGKRCSCDRHCDAYGDCCPSYQDICVDWCQFFGSQCQDDSPRW